MGKSGIIVTGLVGIALVIAAVLVFGGNNDDGGQQSTNQPTTSSPQQPTTNNAEPSATNEATVITYNGSLFSPSQVTVNKGDTITIKNDSSVPVDVESTPHPVHTDNTELNLGQIEVGKNTSFSISQVGSWGYHNHLDPTQTGTIVVR
ncbi:cupredoxin domain-containing protein [Candidatus Saccharibacteria bacterium]|nr:cupredoxin domain-containing protein [Candidatus Saccharibacteria bacterium]